MLRISILLLLLISVVYAANSDYIIAFKAPVTDKTYTNAKADIEAAGGKVIYELRVAMKGIVVSIPNDEITTFTTKSYVDFMEEDRSVHIL